MCTYLQLNNLFLLKFFQSRPHSLNAAVEPIYKTNSRVPIKASSYESELMTLTYDGINNNIIKLAKCGNKALLIKFSNVQLPAIKHY